MLADKSMGERHSPNCGDLSQGAALAAPSFSNDAVTFSTLNGMIYPDYAANGMWIYSGDWSQIPGYIDGFLSGAI